MAITIEDGIYTEVTSNTAVAAFINTRLYANNMPQNSIYPAITYERIAGMKVHTQGQDSGVAETLYQFTIYSEQFDEAVNIREALRPVLQDFSGDIGSKGVTVLAVLMDDGGEGYDSSVEKYYQRLDFEIIHLESRTT